MSSVFISYSSKDRETALKVKAALESHGISVTIDVDHFSAGYVLTELIDTAIRDCRFTLTIISPESLASSWVGIECITAIYGEKFDEDKGYFACYIDDSFLKRDFLIKAVDRVDSEIEDIKKVINECEEKRIVTPIDLLEERRRYEDLRQNLPKILSRLKQSVTVDIREPEFRSGIERIVRRIKEGFGPPTAQRKMELDYLQKLQEEEIRDLKKYTPLGGRSVERHKQLLDYKPFEKADILDDDDGKALTPRRFDDAVGEILRLKRAVVLGEPGAGKTTTLWKLAGDLLDKAFSSEIAPIPLLIRLGLWTDEKQTLLDFLRDRIGGLGAYLEQLLHSKRTVLLLDGLNELPVGQRKEKTAQIKALIDDKKLSDLTVIISCRLLDFEDNDLKLDRIEIVPLDSLQIKTFVTGYLGPDKGDTLFWQLAGKEAHQYYRSFHSNVEENFKAKLPDLEQIFWNETVLPSDISWWSWNKWLRYRENPSSLMVLAKNPFMLWMLYCVYDEKSDRLPENRGNLFRRFVRTLFAREKIAVEAHDKIANGLSKVAFEMQTRRTGQEDGNALTVLPRRDVEGLIDEEMIAIATRASILSPGDEIRFTHQLLQEYFAARHMDLEIKDGSLVASDRWPAANWWERNNWEEATVLLAGLHSNDCTEVINWVADANPEVAAMCIRKSGATCPPATLEDLRRRWLPRLTDLQRDPDPRARAAVGRALGMTGLDNRPGVGVTDKAGVVLPDIDWVDIEGGEFEYGDDDQSDNPRQRLTLDSFRISRYPITFRQFQLFIDDPEGMRDDRWLAGLDCDLKKEQEPGEQAFPFDNHPRERVSWYQAIAFCRWFSWRLGGEYDLDRVDRWMIRLPTEFEWERAARGRTGRKYAYGEEYDPSRGNTFETGIGQTSAVGIFPHGASPDKVIDMTGNVWEWCLGTYNNSQIDPANENLAAGGSRLVRGGSWGFIQDGARAAYRDFNHPASRNNYFGVRVVFGLRPPSLNH